MKAKGKKKIKKKRAAHYDKPLKIYATFEQAVQAIVREPESENKKKK